jgi:transcriptional regulator with XRE-family HTH domain
VEEMSKNKTSPGLKIKELRERMGWTQEQLARFTGLSRVYINNLEQGRVPRPSYNVIKKLADIFNRPMEQMWQ